MNLEILNVEEKRMQLSTVRSYRSRRKREQRKPMLKCFSCKHVVESVLVNGAMETVLHHPDTGEPVNREDHPGCIGQHLQRLAVPIL